MRYLNLLFLLTSSLVFGQSIEGRFVVNAEFVNQTNQQIFETLERSLNEFLNANAWTEEDLPPKKECAAA